MRVLVACEESQEVCKAFRARGHEAYSNDIIECSGGHPEWHLQMDCREAIKSRFWDLIIIHIPCTKVAVSGNRWYGIGMARHNERIEAVQWSRETWELCKQNSKQCILENPVSVLFKELSFEDIYYIQPHQFGHGETKKTGLGTWGNVKRLTATNNVEGREQRIWKMPPSPERAKLRSKTFPGIAAAFADQLG